MEKHSHLSFQHPSRSLKLFNEKENEHKHVNKKTDLLATLQNIKLPSYESISNQRNFQSINLTSSVNIWNR